MKDLPLGFAALVFREIPLVAAAMRTDVHLGAPTVPVSDVRLQSLVLTACEEPW